MLRRWKRLGRQIQGLERSVEHLAKNLARTTAALARVEADRRGAPPSVPLRTICTQAQMESREHARWCGQLGETPSYHRKQWEFSFICRALEERGLLAPGKRGLGFGVGEEPLAAAFAAYGCSIVATDLAATEAADRGWVDTGQHAGSRDELNARGLCPPEAFAERVRFRVVDMNAIPDDLEGFDFCWSACALEHLGSLEHGMRFVERSVACLRPGGVAVHTTELNLSSNDDTLSTGGTVLYRRRDFEALTRRLCAQGHEVVPLDDDLGDGLVDGFVDVPPYQADCHLRLDLAGYVCTSAGLIVTRGEPR